MLDRRYPNVLLLLLGCITCLELASVVNADGRVFVLELRNSSGLLGFRDAERACALQHARLASAEELHHAVADCYFSTCNRGWLHGGTVGTTVCNIAGSTLKAVDVKTENVTEDITNLDAFCIKDEGKPCGDPPSFPNAQLQGHTGFEMGDELLYSCMPGYVMRSGNSAFSLLCDSCGEWYGLVQLCVKDDTEAHVDYEDKFTDSYKQHKGPEEAGGEIHEEVLEAVYPDGKGFQGHSEIMFTDASEAEHQDQHVEVDEPAELIDFSKKLDEAAIGEEQAEEGAVGDFIVNQSWGQERKEVVKTEDAPATDSPVSLLSQKHLFWFPSEAFQEGRPVSTNSATQSTHRSSGTQSEESKEHDSKERDRQHPVDFVSQETFYDKDEHRDSDRHNDSRRHDHDNQDSHQDDKDDRVIHFIPTQHNVDLSKRDRYGDHDDHYDMGEHEDDRVRYSSQEYEDRGQTYDEHESYEDHEDLTDDHSDGDREHPDSSREHLDHDNHDDAEEPYDPDDNDSYEDNSRQHVVFSIEHEQHNATQKTTGVKATTDDTWLDGYPIVQKDDSTKEKLRPEQRESGTILHGTETPNEIGVHRSVSITGSTNEPISPTTEPGLEEKGAEEEWPGLKPTAAAHPDPSDSHSYSDTVDYDTQQAAPTNSWPGDLTEHPYLDHGPAPPLNDMDVDGGTGAVEEHTIDNLPGEAGERGEVEGEKGEAVCTDENCPPLPPGSSRKGPTVAAIIIAVCVVAAAVIMGVWCYRRQLQKSSVYEMNGKGQNPKRQGQQIEMQQKV